MCGWSLSGVNSLSSDCERSLFETSLPPSSTHSVPRCRTNGASSFVFLDIVQFRLLQSDTWILAFAVYISKRDDAYEMLYAFPTRCDGGLARWVKDCCENLLSNKMITTGRGTDEVWSNFIHFPYERISWPRKRFNTKNKWVGKSTHLTLILLRCSWSQSSSWLTERLWNPKNYFTMLRYSLNFLLLEGADKSGKCLLK